MSMRMSEDGRRIVKDFEGIVLDKRTGLATAYQCDAGRWTIGWGHTRRVRQGMHATLDECEAWLSDDLRTAEDAVNEAVFTGHHHYPQCSFDALVSLVFNIGAGPKGFGGSTIRRLLREGAHPDAVGSQFVRWHKVKGQLHQGLLMRRGRELFLFARGWPVES